MKNILIALIACFALQTQLVFADEATQAPAEARPGILIPGKVVSIENTKPAMTQEEWNAKNKDENQEGYKKSYFLRAFFGIGGAAAQCKEQKGRLLEGQPMLGTGKNLDLTVGCAFDSGNKMLSRIRFIPTTEADKSPLAEKLVVSYTVNGEVIEGLESDTYSANDEYSFYVQRGEVAENIIKKTPIFFPLWH